MLLRHPSHREFVCYLVARRPSNPVFIQWAKNSDFDLEETFYTAARNEGILNDHLLKSMLANNVTHVSLHVAIINVQLITNIQLILIFNFMISPDESDWIGILHNSVLYVVLFVAGERYHGN